MDYIDAAKEFSRKLANSGIERTPAQIIRWAVALLKSHKVEFDEGTIRQLIVGSTIDPVGFRISLGEPFFKPVDAVKVRVAE